MDKFLSHYQDVAQRLALSDADSKEAMQVVLMKLAKLGTAQEVLDAAEQYSTWTNLKISLAMGCFTLAALEPFRLSNVFCWGSRAKTRKAVLSSIRLNLKVHLEAKSWADKNVVVLRSVPSMDERLGGANYDESHMRCTVDALVERGEIDEAISRLYAFIECARDDIACFQLGIAYRELEGSAVTSGVRWSETAFLQVHLERAESECIWAMQRSEELKSAVSLSNKKL
jgi:hypothetical protein